MSNSIARTRIELKYTRPKIFRRIDVPLSFTLWSMHAVIQAAFGWDGDHLWAFFLGKNDLRKLDMYGQFGWGPDEEETETLRLKTLVDWGVRKFTYTYDFGDTWEHSITIQRVLAEEPNIEYPHLVAGACSDAIEDIGGISGFYRFVEVAKDPDHPDRRGFEERFTEDFMDSFDHNRFDKELVQGRLDGIM